MFSYDGFLKSFDWLHIVKLLYLKVRLLLRSLIILLGSGSLYCSYKNVVFEMSNKVSCSGGAQKLISLFPVAAGEILFIHRVW